MIAVILLWLFAPVPLSPGFDAIAKQAASARAENRAIEAIHLYREGVKLKPDWSEGWWYLGTLLYEQDQFAAARDAFRNVTKTDPNGGPAWAMLGLCEYQTREYQAALAHLQEGLRSGLGDNSSLTHVARYHRAIILTHLSEFESALQTFVLLAADNVEDPRVMPASGMAALRMPLLPSELPVEKRLLVMEVGRAVVDTAARRAAEARQEWEAIVAKYGDQPNIHYLYGGFLLLSEPDAAIKEWQRELEITPKHVPARLQLAYEYLKRGDAVAAQPYAEQAAALEPDSFVVHNALGRTLVESGDLKRGIAEIEKACQMAPESPENHVALASAYSKAGRRADAAREREIFLKLKKAQEP